MRVLLAADSIITLDMLLNEMSARSWPAGTEALVLSVVEDDDVPEEVWREMGHGTDALRVQIRRRGKLITSLATIRLDELGISSKTTIMRGNPVSVLAELSETVANRAHCSVKIIRRREAFEDGQSLARDLTPSDHRGRTVYELTENRAWKSVADKASRSAGRAHSHPNTPTIRKSRRRMLTDCD